VKYRNTILAATLMGIALPAHSFTILARTLPLTAAPSYGGSMQIAVAKPRLIYAEFKAAQQPQQGTVAAIINRYIEEMDGGIRPLGESNRITLRRIQRHWLGAKVAAALDKRDIIDYCRERRKDVCPATINGDLTSLTSALKYAGSAWDDCEGVSDDAITDAKPFLKKHDLLGKSTPRTRRPTADEKLALETRFAAQNLHPRTTTDMVRVSKWQHASSRRIGESCALLWRDWMPDEQTILVRKMKDPKNRAKQKVVALPHDAQALLYAWALRARREAGAAQRRAAHPAVQLEDLQPALHAREEGTADREPAPPRRSARPRLAARGGRRLLGRGGDPVHRARDDGDFPAHVHGAEPVARGDEGAGIAARSPQ
jgi:integrase